MIYLYKILPLFLLPTGVTIILLVTGLRLRRRSLLWAALAVLWLSSTPLISRFAIRAIEGWSERRAPAAVPAADAIVVLSEGRTTAPGPAAVSEWHDADRFFGGVELFKAGKAPLLVFTGGAAPWQLAAPLEGDVLAARAAEMGVPPAQILKTPRVLNTSDEAHAVAALLNARKPAAGPVDKKHRVLLVTSAFHMQRARTLFERAGLSVIPFPVDFKAGAGESLSALDILPNAGALELTETALREAYGRLFYVVVR